MTGFSARDQSTLTPRLRWDGRVKILIVEDDADVLDVLKFQVERLGHDVVTANAVPPALELVPSTDFVITDLNLGTETCGPIILAAREAGIEAAVISATPDSVGEDVTVLTKPVSIAELRRILGEAA